jgi:hypothetical protein
MMEQRTETQRREGVRATEARVAREARTLPPTVSESDFAAFMETPAGQAIGSAAARQGLWAEERREAAEIATQSAIQRYVGSRTALQNVEAENAKYKAWQDDPDQFLYNSSQAARRQTLEGARDQIENMAPEKVTPVEWQGLLAEQRRAEKIFVRPLKRKPQQPQNIRELLSKMPNAAFDGDPRTAQKAWVISDRGSVNEVDLEPVKPFRFPEGQQPYQLFTQDGTTMYREPTGKPVKMGAGRRETGGFDADDISKAFKEAGEALKEKGVSVTDEKTGKTTFREPTPAEINEAGMARLQSQQDAQRLLQRRALVLESESANELFEGIAENDPGFVQAMQVIQQPHRATARQVEDAAKYIALRIRETVAGIDMPDTLREDLAKADAVLSRIVATRKLPFGVTGGP